LIAFNDTVHTDGYLAVSFQITKESAFSKTSLAGGLMLKLANDIQNVRITGTALNAQHTLSNGMDGGVDVPIAR